VQVLNSRRKESRWRLEGCNKVSENADCNIALEQRSFLRARAQARLTSQYVFVTSQMHTFSIRVFCHPIICTAFDVGPPCKLFFAWDPRAFLCPKPRSFSQHCQSQLIGRSPSEIWQIKLFILFPSWVRTPTLLNSILCLYSRVDREAANEVRKLSV
jgi:hypothetical protein